MPRRTSTDNDQFFIDVHDGQVIGAVVVEVDVVAGTVVVVVVVEVELVVVVVPN